MKNQQESLKKQHPVPQNIMEVEFKLIGDMTIRQFSYVAGGAVLCYFIYSQNIPSPIRWSLIFLVGATALGIAFLPMEERGMDQWVKNFFIACYSPTQRIWKEKGRSQKRHLQRAAPLPKATPHRHNVKIPSEELEKISKEFTKKIRNTYPKDLPQEKLVEKTAEISKDLDRILAHLEKPKEEPLSNKNLQEENKRLRKQIALLGEKYKRLKEQETLKTTPTDLRKTIAFYREKLETMEEKNKALEEELRKINRTGKKSPREALELKEYRKQIGNLKNENKKLSQKAAAASRQAKNLKRKVARLESENENYAEQLTAKEKELKRLEDERNKAVGSMLQLSREVRKLKGGAPHRRETELPASTPKSRFPARKAETVGRTEGKEEWSAPIIKDIPNVINGIVKNKAGTLLSGAVVIIEDEDGDPVRALKTNKLGQFAISTPLPNGTYTVKVEGEGGFPPIKVLADGSILKPIIFKEQ